SMRPADAAAGSPPALTATIAIKAATAYSLLVFATGPGGALRGDLVNDDLTAPNAGSARVRVVQGSASLAPVTLTAAGQPLISDLGYGVTSPYTTVPAGRFPIVLRAGGKEFPSTVD